VVDRQRGVHSAGKDYLARGCFVRGYELRGQVNITIQTLLFGYY
jgi:hypothetical protein